MKLPAIPLALIVTCGLSLPAIASQPQGLAGKLIGNPNVISRNCASGLPSTTIESFDWYEYFGSSPIDPAHTVRLDLALIPFRSGPTYLALDASEGPVTFLQIMFSDGLVNGIPYNRSGWNDVAVRLRPAAQDYTITINGVTGGPFPFDDSCQATGGCFSIQALRVIAPSSGDDAVAWLDSVTIFDEATVGYGNIYELDFDRCDRPSVTWGGLLISEPPRRPGRTGL